MHASLNHVTVQVDELEASIRFYEEMFGLERLVAPNFGVPVAWLRVGDLQVHLTERPGPPSGHFALQVADLGAVYRRAVENGSLARDAQGHAVYILPSGEIQLYVLDPSSNVVEVNHHDAERWRTEIPEMVALGDLHGQSEDAPSATLFLFREAAGG
jgi:catechol 2,3-dioxygenase-like lactoylglutathione lyase family enzyme